MSQWSMIPWSFISRRWAHEHGQAFDDQIISLDHQLIGHRTATSITNGNHFGCSFCTKMPTLYEYHTEFENVTKINFYKPPNHSVSPQQAGVSWDNSATWCPRWTDCLIEVVLERKVQSWPSQKERKRQNSVPHPVQASARKFRQPKRQMTWDATAAVLPPISNRTAASTLAPWPNYYTTVAIRYRIPIRLTDSDWLISIKLIQFIQSTPIEWSRRRLPHDRRLQPRGKWICLMPGFHHSVAVTVLPLPFRCAACAVVSLWRSVVPLPFCSTLTIVLLCVVLCFVFILYFSPIQIFSHLGYKCV